MREDFPEWGIHFAPSLPWGALGVTRWADQTVWLVDGLTQVQRRCVLEHERQHIILGGHSCDDVDEQVVEQATARALVTLDDVRSAVRWSRDMREVAEHCWVTLDVLRCRVRHLHPAERAALAHAVEHHVA